jgi:Ca2+/Na+ antiporter
VYTAAAAAAALVSTHTAPSLSLSLSLSLSFQFHFSVLLYGTSAVEKLPFMSVVQLLLIVEMELLLENSIKVGRRDSILLSGFYFLLVCLSFRSV